MSRSALRAALMAAALAVSPFLQAQYKVVEPDGRITYTDRPAPTAPAQALRLGSTAAPAPVDALPFDLRQPASRFPVTLYTTVPCPSCDQARSFLRQRGIPFTEKSVISSADIQAWEALGLGNDLPVVRIGQQVLRGFQRSAWATDLDLAGYPATSRLPASYRVWEATPLVGATPAAAPAAPAELVAPSPRPGNPAPPSPPAPPTAPGGFRF